MKLPVYVFMALLLLGCAEKKNKSQLQGFHIADGFEITLFAAEPLIADPVAMEVDENGTMYVVEMHGYPLDKSGSGKVKVLKDTDRDGLPDKAIVFTDNLTLPTGIMRWKKGVLVTDPPNVLYLEDKDGDDVADIRDTLLTGLALSNPQHNANTPLYGLDNWIYIAHESSITPVLYTAEFGDKGSTVRYAGVKDGPGLPLNANGRNIRFRPDQQLLEMCSGESQYGQTFSPSGHHFLTSNAHHIFHEAIAARYLQKNTILQLADATETIPDHGNASEVYPVTKNPEHQLLTDVGVITSSCGITWYQGGLFPDSFNNVTFIAEPVHNLVHADRITARGSSFTASRVYEKKEFLASEDPWFRPVQFYIGPDGALYVIDYYRQYIEHPEWMSEEMAKSGALYNGMDKGRIYRIAPRNSAAPGWLDRTILGNMSVEEIANALGSRNIWWRRNAQRLLVDRKQAASVPMILNAFYRDSPYGAIHAMWTLEGMGMLPDSVLLRALNGLPELRENALKIAETRINSPEIRAQLLKMSNDHDPRVSYQLLCSSVFMEGPETEQLRKDILLRFMDDKWVRFAALAASPGKEETLMREVIAKTDLPALGRLEFIANCASLLTLRSSGDIGGSLSQLSNTAADPRVREAIISGITTALSARPIAITAQRTLAGALIPMVSVETDTMLRRAAVKLLKQCSAGLQSIPAKWAADAQNNSLPPAYRRDCIELLALSPGSINSSALLGMVTSSQPEQILQAAAGSFLQLANEQEVKQLISGWQRLPDGARSVVLEHCVEDEKKHPLLLNAIGRNEIPSSAIAWNAQVALMNNDNLATRERARKTFAAGDRGKALEKFSAALALKGNADNGAKVFQINCSTCHQVNNKDGQHFGPDLASIRNREQKFILADIIQPDRAIADGYEWWEIELVSGEKTAGIISAETGTSVSLRDPSGKETILKRSDIRQMRNSNRSMMPSGLEQNMSLQDMADLLAYLTRR